MPLSDDWLAQRRRIPHLTTTALPIGTGCDAGQISAVAQYLDAAIDRSSAARRLTATITDEDETQLDALWTLLSDLMVELPNELDKVVEIMQAIEALPPGLQTDWPQLHRFHEVWYERYRTHLDSHLAWENDDLEDDRVSGLRAYHHAIGRAESEIYLCGLMPAFRGYEVISMVCQGRKGIDVLLSEVYGWMSGSTSLRYDVDDPLESRSYRYAGLAIREATMEDHWDNWTAQVLAFSQDDSVMEDGRALSDEGRKLAGRIHVHLRDGLWDGYGGISSATGV